MSGDTNTVDLAGDAAQVSTHDLAAFNFNARAELFVPRSRATKSPPTCKRFDTAAEAVRFVVEEMPAAVSSGAYLLVETTRFALEEIRSLYESAGYPLPRHIENC
jgi:hypothetical protein